MHGRVAEADIALSA